MTGCFSDFGSNYTSWIPDLSVSTQVPRATNSDVQRVEKYLLPSYIADWDPEVQQRCADGEDMRAHFGTQYAMIEVQRWGVLLNGVYTTSLNDGVLDTSGYRGLLLPLLYDALLAMRLNAEATMSGLACWSGSQKRLLVVAEPATDWGLVQRIVYTAHQAGFPDVDLLVDDAAAVADATASPPYPLFSGSEQEEREALPRLSEEEIDKAREMLARGQRVRETGARCSDRLEAFFSANGTRTLSGQSSFGYALDADHPSDPALIDPAGSLDIVVAAQPDTEYGDLVDGIVSLRGDNPSASLMFDESTSANPSFQALGVVASTHYKSFSKETWIPVIEIEPERIGQTLSCIDDEGNLHEL